MKQIKIVTSGTGIERASRGLGTGIDFFLGVTYNELLQGKSGHAKEFSGKYLKTLDPVKNKSEIEIVKKAIENIEEAKSSLSYLVDAEFYRMIIPFATHVIDTYREENLFKWGKIFKDVTKSSAILEDVMRALFGRTSKPELMKLNLSGALEDEIKVVQIFTACRECKELNKFAELVKNVLGDAFIVETLSGEFTSNDKSEERVNSSIARGKIEGKGVIILTMDMGSRSFSISEINPVILMLDNGSINPITQKISRAFTPGKKHNGENKKVGSVVSLSVDSNRIDIIDSILVREAIRSQLPGESMEKALRRVLMSINLFSIDDNNNRIDLVKDFDYWQEICNRVDITRLADSTISYENFLDDLQVLDVLTNVIGEKAKWVDFTFSEEGEQLPTNTPTYKEKMEARGKELKDPNSREELLKKIKEAVSKINNRIGNILEINDFRDTSLRETFCDISKDALKTSALESLIGIAPLQATLLVDKGVLNNNLLDVYIKLVIQELEAKKLELIN
jgi:hypothetical protein